MRSRGSIPIGNSAGFTLIEMLLATALMLVILGSLATVTAEWMPNWNRGMARLQREVRLMSGLERIVADLAAAQFVTLDARSKRLYFEGRELGVTFVRTTLGPSARAGLEVVHYYETTDAEGYAFVRETAPFTPILAEAPPHFGAPVVLVKTPFRISLSYSGKDGRTQTSWLEKAQLPEVVRLTVRDAGSGQVLPVSTAAVIRVDADAECATSRDPVECLKSRQTPAPVSQVPP